MPDVLLGSYVLLFPVRGGLRVLRRLLRVRRGLLLESERRDEMYRHSPVRCDAMRSNLGELLSRDPHLGPARDVNFFCWDEPREKEQ